MVGGPAQKTNGLAFSPPSFLWTDTHETRDMPARKDGMPARKRVRGRAFGQRLGGFGERVRWKLQTKGPQHDKEGNMSARWVGGIFVGYNRKSNSYRIIDDNGDVQRSRALARKPMAERWSVEALSEIKATPWSIMPRDGAA